MPVVLDDSTAAIGAVQSAFLTEVQFQSQFGIGWVLADGRTVSRTFSGSITNGSANVTVSSTTGLFAGMLLSGTGIAVGATISSITSGTVFVMSLTAIATNAASSITAGTRYSAITGSTSVPDLRGMFLRGKNSGRADGLQAPDIVLTGTITNASANVSIPIPEDSSYDLNDIQVGQSISGTNIPAGATVVSATQSGSTISVVMSAVATASGSRSITFSGDLPVGGFQKEGLRTHDHTIRLWVGADDNNHTAGDVAAGGDYTYSGYNRRTDFAIEARGGSETRPKNVTVNHFIRIN